MKAAKSYNLALISNLAIIDRAGGDLLVPPEVLQTPGDGHLVRRSDYSRIWGRGGGRGIRSDQIDEGT